MLCMPSAHVMSAGEACGCCVYCISVGSGWSVHDVQLSGQNTRNDFQRTCLSTSFTSKDNSIPKKKRTGGCSLVLTFALFFVTACLIRSIFFKVNESTDQGITPVYSVRVYSEKPALTQIKKQIDFSCVAEKDTWNHHPTIARLTRHPTHQNNPGVAAGI